MLPHPAFVLAAILLGSHSAAAAAAEAKEGAVMMHEMNAPASTTIVLTEGIHTTVVMPLPSDEEGTGPAPTAPAPVPGVTSLIAPVPVSTAGAEQVPRDGGSVLGMAVACGLGLLAL